MNAPGRIFLKSPREIELMRAAGHLVHSVLDELEQMIVPGVTTRELDAVATRMIEEAGAIALFKGVEHPQARYPFPASICSSVNDAVVHGLPTDRPLEEGDIISIDCGVKLKGYCGDHARTFPVGKVAAATQDLLDVTRETLDASIGAIRPGVRWREIARLMQQMVERHGYGVVRDFVGHGIGREMHEEPKVPNYVDRQAADFQLAAGMTLAVEPMVTAGDAAVEYEDRDGWTVVTKDRSLAAHFEHTVAVTADGAEILTLP